MSLFSSSDKYHFEIAWHEFLGWGACKGGGAQKILIEGQTLPYVQGEETQLWGCNQMADEEDLWKVLLKIPLFHVGGGYKVPFLSSQAILHKAEVEIDEKNLAWWMAEHDKTHIRCYTLGLKKLSWGFAQEWL